MKSLIIITSLLTSLCLAQTDKALSVIDQATEENKKYLPPPIEKFGLGLSAEIGFPHPVRWSLEYEHPDQIWSAALSFGSIRMTPDQADLNLNYSEIAVRWHLRQDSLFVGLGIGNQTIQAKESGSFAGQPATLEAQVKSSYLKPMVGWIWKKPNQRLFWGLELGLMLPVSDDYKLTSSLDLTGTPEYDDTVQEVKDVADFLGRTTLISVGMLRVGWIF